MLDRTTQVEAVNNTDPAVSVIVPCRNERDHIETVIKLILAQEPPPGGFEVIVADGMSDDGTREILRRLSNEDSRLQVVDNPGRIVSKGLNVGIRKAKGNVIMRMDAHTEYAADYILNCVEVLRATGADNVGGPWIARGEGRIGQAIAAAFQSSFASGAPVRTIRTIPVRSIQSILVAGPARYSIALACLTRNWFGIRTTNLTSGLRVRAEQSGSRPKSRVGTILVNRCELC